MDGLICGIVYVKDIMYKKMGFKEYGMNPRAFKLKDGTYRYEIITEDNLTKDRQRFNE